MNPFENHEQAVLYFVSKMRTSTWKSQAQRSSGMNTDIQCKINTSKKADTEIEAWLAASNHLPTPWPSPLLTTLLQFKNNGPYPEIFGWLTPARVGFLQSLLDRGANPLEFVPEAHATLLGFAVYTQSLKALEVLVNYCQAPASRLVLTSEHVPSNSKSLNSTLLHRFCARVKKSPESLQIIDCLLEHDPDAVLAKNAAGKYPHNSALHAPLAQEVKARYVHRVAQVQAQRILSELEVPDTSKPSRKI